MHRDGRRSTLAFVLAGGMTALLLDQLTKFWILHRLSGGPMAGIGPLRFALVSNRGIVFGVPAPTWLVLAGIACAAAFVLSRATRGSGSRLAMALILGGALGNGLDRFLMRADFPAGAVVDWIAIPGFATFNVADVFLVVGIIMLMNADAAPSESGNNADPDAAPRATGLELAGTRERNG